MPSETSNQDDDKAAPRGPDSDIKAAIVAMILWIVAMGAAISLLYELLSGHF